MDFPQAIDNLRIRLKEAREKSLEGGFEMSEQMLEQVAIEAEKFRKECLRQADSLENQAKACRWQADAYSAVSAIVYRTFNGFVSAEEKRQAEMAAAEAERLEREAPEQPTPEPEPLKKRRGKTAE